VPGLCLSWGKVDVQIFTHRIGGLAGNDFIFAAKIDQVVADPS
jgi:4a-hydroxytetrahydrobiopterin dehydratase